MTSNTKNKWMLAAPLAGLAAMFFMTPRQTGTGMVNMTMFDHRRAEIRAIGRWHPARPFGRNRIRASVAHPLLFKTKHVPKKIKLSAPPVLEKADMDHMHLRRMQADSYVVKFQGTAIEAQRPCAHAKILIRVLSGDESRNQTVFADAEGRFAASMAIDVESNDHIDWTIEGYRPGFRLAELGGHQIIMKDDEHQITLQPRVEFSDN